MDKLPIGWCECFLEDVCNIYTGNSINEQEKASKYIGLKHGYNYIATKDIDFNNVINYENGVKIPYNTNFKLAPSFTALLCIEGGSAGRKVAFSTQEVCFGNKLCAFNTYMNDYNFSKLVYFYLQTMEFKSIFALKKNGLIGGVSLNKIKKLPINLPPLAEQIRIVEKIEELFSDIDDGIKSLKIAQAQIKQYKQSVLKSAFEGKLTEAWRICNILDKQLGVKENSTSLYDIPNTWLWCNLSEVGSLNRGKSKHRPRDDYRLFGGGYPFIQTGDIKKANKYIYEYSQTYNEFGLAQSKLWNEDTLCITIAANIAETSILKIKACFPDSIVGFVKNDRLCKVELVEYYIRTIKGKLEKYAPATAQKNINLSTLNEVLFPLPPIKEQIQIVSEIEKRFAVADEMDEAVKDSLDKAEKLKQSILKKAFSGKLVPQDPNDEPASVLLARIKAEKSTPTPKIKGKKK